MQYQTIISIEKVFCKRTSNAALYELKQSTSNRGNSLPAVTECDPEECAVNDWLILLAECDSRLTFLELGSFGPSDFQFTNKLVRHGDSDVAPRIKLTLIRMDLLELNRTVLGQVTFHHRGKGELGWECGLETQTEAPLRPGLFRFEMTGGGGHYNVYFRAAILDCSIAEFSE